MDLGKHAIFIWSSYAVAGAVLAALVIWLINEGRRYRKRLEDLEAAGVSRRSQA